LVLYPQSCVCSFRPMQHRQCARFRTTVNFDRIYFYNRIDIDINIDIDKRKTAFTTTIDSTSNAAKMVNLRSKIIKFCCLISNYPSLTLHLLHMYMIMQLHSFHVTLLQTKFQPLNCLPNRTYGAGRLYVGLCPIFLVCFYREISEVCGPIFAKFCYTFGSKFNL